MTAPVLTGVGAAHVTGTGAGFAPHRGDDRIPTCVEVAWNYDPTLPFGNQWSDVTQYVRDLTTNRGRQQELQRFEAGTLSMRLSNADGRFNPWNTAGAYGSGAVRIGVPIRVRISAEKSDPTGTTPSASVFDPTDGGFFPAWYGFITDLQPGWSPGGKFDGWCDVQAADALALLNRADLVAAVFPNGISTTQSGLPADGSLEFATDRVLGVLDQSGVKQMLPGVYLFRETWSNFGDPKPFSPEVASGPGSPISANTMQYLGDLADSGFIDVYVRPDGMLAWRPFNEIRNQAFDTTTIFGDNAGEIPYTDASPIYDDQNLFNDISITVDSGTLTATDAASKATYGRRVLEKTFPIAGFGDAGVEPGDFITRYKDPVVRIPTITVSLRGLTDAQRMRVLSLPIGYRVQVKRRPTTGDALTAECYFEGCQLSWEPGMVDVKAVLNLAPVRPVNAYTDPVPH